MSIDELFKKLKEEFGSEEYGEFILNNNSIIWEFEITNYDNNLDSENEEMDDDYYYEISSYSNEDSYEDFNDIKERIEFFLDDLNVFEEFSILEPKFIGNYKFIFKIIKN